MLDVDAALRKALKEKEHALLMGYRSLKTKISNKLSEAGRGADKPLAEAELHALVAREIKERREANEYLTPERPEHRENARIVEALEAHLPRALSPGELEAAIAKAIAEVQAAGPGDLGKVMALLRRVPGLDMAASSARVKALLSGG
jgi:uncharacterized protein YqeY